MLSLNKLNKFKWSAPFNVLIVDDDSLHLRLSQKVLTGSRFCVFSASHGEEALDLLRKQSMDVVVLDKCMPGMNGLEVCRRIREEPELNFLQIIIVTASTETSELSQSLEAGANDFIRKPYLIEELRARVTAAGNHKRMTDQLDSAESMLFTLARMVEAKDNHTGDHCARLSHVAVAFGRELGLDEEELLALYRGGVLHDLGKLGIPDSILLKKGALSSDEWEIMREHTTIGVRLCSGLKSMTTTLPIIQYHHERWDGSGYPEGLKGDEIPLLARIFQVVDIYDALMSERSYKSALPRDEVVSILEEEVRKGWLDPELVEKFLDLVRNRPGLLDVPAVVEAQLGDNIFDEVIKTGVLDWDKPYKAEKAVEA
ncbi:HD domain-containing phosphohydrolase [Pseudomonadota bacterium]